MFITPQVTAFAQRHKDRLGLLSERRPILLHEAQHIHWHFGDPRLIAFAMLDMEDRVPLSRLEVAPVELGGFFPSQTQPHENCYACGARCAAAPALQQEGFACWLRALVIASLPARAGRP